MSWISLWRLLPEVLSLILTLSGIFASAGVVQIVQRLVRELFARRKLEAAHRAGRSYPTDSAPPELGEIPRVPTLPKTGREESRPKRPERRIARRRSPRPSQ